MSPRSAVAALFRLPVVLAALAGVSPAAADLGCRTSVASETQPDGLCGPSLGHGFVKDWRGSWLVVWGSELLFDTYMKHCGCLSFFAKG